MHKITSYLTATIQIHPIQTQTTTSAKAVATRMNIIKNGPNNCRVYGTPTLSAINSTIIRWQDVAFSRRLNNAWRLKSSIPIIHK